MPSTAEASSHTGLRLVTMVDLASEPQVVEPEYTVTKGARPASLSNMQLSLVSTSVADTGTGLWKWEGERNGE